MTQINPYINFNGNCREAMTFYQECIGGKLNLQTIEHSPLEARCTVAMKHHILHSSLTKDALILMGSDMVSPDGFKKGNNIALSVNCSSADEINTFFLKLKAGGKIIDPLKKQFWGAMFGALKDKFGIIWMFNNNMDLDK